MFFVSSSLKLRSLATSPCQGPPPAGAEDVLDDPAAEGPAGDDNEAEAEAEADADAFLADVGVPAVDVVLVVMVVGA